MLFGERAREVLEMAREARDLSKANQANLETHMRDCMELSRDTKRILSELKGTVESVGTALANAGQDRTQQFASVNNFMWKIALMIISGLVIAISGILFQVAKTKGLI